MKKEYTDTERLQWVAQNCELKLNRGTAGKEDYNLRRLREKIDETMELEKLD